MSVSIRFDIDEAAVQRMLTSRGGLVGRRVEEVTERVATAVQVRAPVREGHLKASVRTAYSSTAGEVVGYVYSDLDYSVYVQRGTGLYGPRGQPIRGRPILVFEVGGRTVFAREVKGQHSNPFMIEGLRAGSPWPVTAFPPN